MVNAIELLSNRINCRECHRNGTERLDVVFSVGGQFSQLKLLINSAFRAIHCKRRVKSMCRRTMTYCKARRFICHVADGRERAHNPVETLHLLNTSKKEKRRKADQQNRQHEHRAQIDQNPTGVAISCFISVLLPSSCIVYVLLRAVHNICPMAVRHDGLHVGQK